MANFPKGKDAKLLALVPLGYGSRAAGRMISSDLLRWFYPSMVFRPASPAPSLSHGTSFQAKSPDSKAKGAVHVFVPVENESDSRREENKMIRQLNDDEVRALHYELLLKDILTAAEKLPPFPDVAWKVMALIKKTASVNEIEAVIKYDQVIAARIIALSQAAYYGRRYVVGSLKDAILVLGDQKLMQVLLTACAMRYFRGQNGGACSASERRLWEHSVATAIMGEMVARYLKQNKLLSTYTAGLLHDIGKIVLDLYARMYLGTDLNQIRQVSPESIAAERRALGIDHQELGEIIARRWKFPQDVISAIGRHHSPEGAGTQGSGTTRGGSGNQSMATIIYVANRIVESFEEENGSASSFDPGRDPIFRMLGVSSGIIENLHARLSEALGDVKQLLANV